LYSREVLHHLKAMALNEVPKTKLSAVVPPATPQGSGLSDGQCVARAAGY